MKRNIKLVIRGVVLAGFCFTLMGGPASATQTELEEVQENIQGLEQEQEDTRQELENLEEDKVYLDGKLSQLDNELSTLARELTSLQEQQKNTEKELLLIQEELEEAKRVEVEQYENMRKRIRFLYERGNSNLLELLLGTTSFADFMNFSEYVESIHTYDRRMLEEYTAIKEEIGAKEARIKEEQQNLLVMAQEQQDKLKRVETVLGEVEAGMANTDQQIAQTQDELSNYEKQLEQQRAYEEKLEAQLAAEDAGRMDEIGKQEEENVAPPIISDSESDITMLAALIECEAGGESYEGKLAVGSVVINRMRSAYFPNTLVEVIYQPRQFSPVASGRFATVLSRGANATCVQAARENLSGTITIDALYFRRNNGTIKGTVIGNHVFY